MPKKTKKQKIEARRHRLQKKQEVIHSPTVQEESAKTPPIPTPQKPQEKKPIFLEHAQQSMHFRNDLLKSLMITMILICIQVAIYVAQLSGSIDITNLLIF